MSASGAAPPSAPDGVLVVDKPRGPTSHDVVDQARKFYRTSRVGHAGTLDPMATGVLVLMFGEALKLSAYLSGASKRYRAIVRFGSATDTLDTEGRTTEVANPPIEALDPEALEHALAFERLRTEQVPPAFSAIKVGGRRAHRQSRRGAPPVLAPRPVSVDALELRDVSGTAVTVELAVSKGYYVRALARDLSSHLGVPAHIEALRRLSSGPFALEEAVGWPPDAQVALLPAGDAARRALPSVRLRESGIRRALHGLALEASDFEPHGGELERSADAPAVAWLAADGKLVAIGHKDSDGAYHVLRGFVPR